jgi:putative DNA primase/helicase
MFVGNGRNGKDKTLELIKRIIGINNCASIPLNQLQPDSFSISELFGKKINLAGDISSIDLKDTSTFKALTGRSQISGKRKFLSEIKFVNYAKMVFACNELPMAYDLSKGYWDRWILLEFPFTFVTKDEYDKAENKEGLKIRDEDIIEKITTKSELSGLLNKFLDGFDRLLKNRRFSSSKGTEEVKNTWIRKSNSFIAFCYDQIEEDGEGKINKKDLRKKYSDYCKEHKVNPKSDVVIKNTLQQTFGATEDDMNVALSGYKYEKFWIGVKWKK